MGEGLLLDSVTFCLSLFQDLSSLIGYRWFCSHAMDTLGIAKLNFYSEHYLRVDSDRAVDLGVFTTTGIILTVGG